MRVTPSMWLCSRIMHALRDLHPTLLAALEGIVDQVCISIGRDQCNIFEIQNVFQNAVLIEEFFLVFFCDVCSYLPKTFLPVYFRWCGSVNVGMKKSYDSCVKSLLNAIKSRLRHELMVRFVPVIYLPLLKPRLPNCSICVLVI